MPPDGSRPIDKPGWYRLGQKGEPPLVCVCGLDEQPEGDRAELVRVEVDPAAAVEEPLW